MRRWSRKGERSRKAEGMTTRLYDSRRRKPVNDGRRRNVESACRGSYCSSTVDGDGEDDGDATSTSVLWSNYVENLGRPGGTRRRSARRRRTLR